MQADYTHIFSFKLISFDLKFLVLFDGYRLSFCCFKGHLLLMSKFYSFAADMIFRLLKDWELKIDDNVRKEDHGVLYKF